MRGVFETWFSENSLRLIECSRSIWEHPEPSGKEYFAVDTLRQLLCEYGFVVGEPPLAGLDTAFEAKWGDGSPHIGFLAEYDALPGLAQTTSPYPEPIEGQNYGHGCGHNLLGVASVAAAAALKTVMEREHIGGTVYLYGCPSEEIMTGKIVMTKAHVFDHLDVAISWHPGDKNRASEESYQAMLSVEYHFHGKASHASINPEEGRSALDAVELMDVGVNYLREHLPRGGQIHYVILDGGAKPNIVPDKASVWQFMRASTAQDVLKISHRLDEIAQGAALMTGTTFEKKILTGCNETRIIPKLVEIMDDTMRHEVSLPLWTENEKQFARELLENLGLNAQQEPLHHGILSLSGKTVPILGSSDLSDVSYVVPTCMLFSACYPIGTPNHTWAVTACAGNSIGTKGMLYAAEVMAATAYRLVSQPELLMEVKKSFSDVMGKTTYSPIC
ncbi:MAG: amidohydrolase [Clostridiaceae bacterium]|jgi:aminobenzoyl-glutamate utilization protein B|nr:amidohydrolase [Clostridiaceae bacterium]